MIRALVTGKLHDAPQQRTSANGKTYTAESIRILEPAEVEERFGWAQAAALAERYRRPEPWIRRGLEACRRAGVEADYFVERYLRKRRDIPRNPAVEECMRELLAEESRS